MNEILMSAVVEAAVFVGVAEDDIVDSDAAVRFLEDLAARLRRLGASERRILGEFIERLAAREESGGGDPRRIEFLRSLMENLGLRAE